MERLNGIIMDGANKITSLAPSKKKFHLWRHGCNVKTDPMTYKGKGVDFMVGGIDGKRYWKVISSF